MRTACLAWTLLTLGCSSSTRAPSSDPHLLLWTEACVRLSGCAPYAAMTDPYFACEAGYTSFMGSSPASCALLAADCPSAVACFGAGAPPIECDGWTEPRCEGEVLFECDAGSQLVIGRDCAAEGLRCRVNELGDPHCAREGPCSEGSCDGNVLVHCFGGIPVPWDICGNGRCVVIDGFATCAGEGEPCERFFRCDADVAVSCRDGFVHREQCRPGACRTDDGARCVATDECAPHCEGTAVVRCVEGAVTRYDCTEWGFSACVEGEYGASCR